MDAVFNWAGSNGFKTIRAEVIKTNSRALRFYKKYGFDNSDSNFSHDGHLILTKQVEPGHGLYR
jgi:RimJ/RimL family protein N-acetyltransferase